ncbi:helix-turn-helix transcriptional regulator [Actinocorallia aurea]
MTDMGGSETSSLQRAFAEELTARREAADMSRARLAELLGCTRQWLDKVETLKSSASPALADDLDTYFATGGSFRRLWNLFDDARRQGLVPTRARPLFEAEKDTTEIDMFEPLLIPGLFQTEDYARLVLSTGADVARLEERLAIRMERQALLYRSEPPWIFLLIREAVLRDLPPSVKAGQCKHLLNLMTLPRFSLQVLPVSAPVFHPTGFQILSFDAAPDLAFVEGTGLNGQMLTDVSRLRLLALYFKQLSTMALSARESESLVNRQMEGS